MLYMEDAKVAFASACGTIERDSEEAMFYHRFANMIPNRIDVETLVLAFKIALQDEEKKGKNTLSYIAIVPHYVRQCSSKEFAHEFRKKYNIEVLGLTQDELPDVDYGYTEIEPDIIDISMKDINEVLAALYNASTPVAVGFMQYDPTPWSKEMAEFYFKKFGEVDPDGYVRFKWIMGRPVNLVFGPGTVNVSGYNNDNEWGLGQRVIATVPNVEKKKMLENK